MDNNESEYVEETALDLFLRLQAPWLTLKSGCPNIDEHLNGGIVKGKITEFVGGVAVGKTQMCLSVVANLLISNGTQQDNIVYIDTNGSFRGTRLLEMLKSRGVQDENEAKQMLTRVLIARVYDENDLRITLANVQDVPNLALLIIDSIGAALAFTAWGYIEGGRDIQDEMIAVLHNIARRGCAIVTTNHFVYWRGKPSPSLGLKWIKTVDSRYLLCKLRDASYMQLINSSCHKVVRGQVFYEISSKGIEIKELYAGQTQNAQPVVTHNWQTIKQIYPPTS